MRSVAPKLALVTLSLIAALLAGCLDSGEEAEAASVDEEEEREWEQRWGEFLANRSTSWRDSGDDWMTSAEAEEAPFRIVTKEFRFEGRFSLGVCTSNIGGSKFCLNPIDGSRLDDEIHAPGEILEVEGALRWDATNPLYRTLRIAFTPGCGDSSCHVEYAGMPDVEFLLEGDLGRHVGFRVEDTFRDMLTGAGPSVPQEFVVEGTYTYLEPRMNGVAWEWSWDYKVPGTPWPPR